MTVVYEREYENLAEPARKLFRPLDLSKFTGYRDAVFKESFFNINVIPQYCKGCGACAEVCKAGAFSLVDKSGVRAGGDQRFLPPEVFEQDVSETVAPYVKEGRYLQQMMLLYSSQKFLPGGHTLCPGCGEGIIENLVFTAAEMVRRQPRFIADFYRSLPALMTREHGRGLQHMIDHRFNLYTVNATGCAEVSCLGNPYNARIYPAGHYGFGTASAAWLAAVSADRQAGSAAEVGTVLKLSHMDDLRWTPRNRPVCVRHAQAGHGRPARMSESHAGTS